jgi:hypothetical protein
VEEMSMFLTENLLGGIGVNTITLREKKWAQEEFGGVKFGDARCSKRLEHIATGLAERPGNSLPQAFPCGADLKAAYRFFANDKVSYEKIKEAHQRRTREECGQPGEYLLVEDTTTLDFTSHKAARGLGRIGDDRGRGLFLHSNLAARVESWNKRNVPEVTLVGLFGQKCWARKEKSGKEKSKARRRRQKRESERWAEAIQASEGPPAGSRWIYVADRESDIYEVFLKCKDRSTDFVVRATQPRVLEEGGGSVLSAVSRSPAKGRYEVELRSRPGSPARTAVVEVRALGAVLRPPRLLGGGVPAAGVGIVEAREICVPEGTGGIHWFLVTTLPVGTFEEATKAIGVYTRRWLIEEYHKALKTGTRIERSQLEEAERVKNLLGVLVVVAVELLNMKLLAVARPEEAIEESEIGEEGLKILESRIGKPGDGWTNRTLYTAIARLGGFLGRRGDGNPGWTVIWRGRRRLVEMIEGYRIAIDIDRERCG